MAEKVIRTQKEMNEVLGRVEREQWTDLALFWVIYGADQNILERIHPKHQFWVSVDSRYWVGRISGFKSLTSLFLSFSSFGGPSSKERSRIGDLGAKEIAKLTNLSSLHLSNNSIGDLGAKEIAKLTNLSSLDLSQNSIGAKGAKEIAKLTNLSSLHLSYNSIGDLGAKEIAKLTNLSSLHLRNNSIGAEGAKEIAKLTNLSSLHLSNNSIGAKGAKEIAKLTNLSSLDLSENSIGAKGAKEIAKLPNLSSLHLSNNSIGDLGAKEIAKLTNLSSLDLSQNSIGAEGAKEIAKLTSLSSLHLGRNGIVAEGAKEIAKLINLSSLHLSGNRIGDLGAKEIAKLTNLSSLDLSQNSIGAEGAKEIAKLTSLSSLDLSYNSIGDLGAKEIAKLPNLSSLHLSNNSIGDLGAKLLLDAYLQNQTIRILDIGGNATTNTFLSQELLNQADAQALLAAYRSYKKAQEKDQLKPLNEVKLLIVGNEAVGKTSLVRALVEGKICDPNESATPGIAQQKIDTRKWKTDSEITANIWDFGGQEVMHGTHRFFLTARSLYLIVLEDRRHDDRSVYEWLETITSRAGDVPIIVVINKSDKEPYGLFLNESGIRKDFSSVVAFVRVSCSKRRKTTINHLKRFLVQTLKKDKRLEHIKTPIPDSWRRVKEALAEKAGQNKILTNEQFTKLCEEGGELAITNEKEQEALRKLLHDLGVIVIYEDTADQTTIKLLDPNWLTTAVYTLINHDEVKKNKGVFAFKDLGTLLPSPEYTKKSHGYIVSMMENHALELCFQLPEKKEYLIPEALPKNEPTEDKLTLWSKDTLFFRMEYNKNKEGALPQGLLPRLIVRLHKYITAERTLWWTGAILKIKECDVLIQGSKQKKMIDIKIAGPQRDRRFALWLVVDELEDLREKQYKALDGSKTVPLPEQPEVSVPYDHLLELERDEGASHSFKPYGANRKYTVKELLEGVGSSQDSPRIERQSREKHFLDEPSFDWSRDENQGLQKILEQAYSTSAQIKQLIQKVKEFDMSGLSFVGSSKDIWSATIDALSKHGSLRSLVDLVLKDPAVKNFHPRLKTVCETE
jgi:internalin A